jgi:saccharopine dehydrogenase (NAD+, L-lysine-forming)
MSAGSKSPVAVAVLGAGGTIAPAIVCDLAASEEVASMLLLDLELARASAVAERFGDGKAAAARADALDVTALARALDGVDVLVNTASYRVNLEAMRACLTAGCHYLDLGGLYWMTGRQLELSPEFERAATLALLGIGSSPGKTNVMARRAVSELRGESVESIEVAAAGRDPEAGPGFSPPYAIQTLIDELTLAPVVVRQKSPVEIEPLTSGGSIDFGEPIGSAETIFTLHSELATFRQSFDCAAASFRLSLAPPLLARLKELAEAPPDDVAAAARGAVPPSSSTVSVHLVTVRGSSGRRVTVRAISRPHFGLGGSIVSTAAPAAAAVRLLARGQLTATGAHPPERCIAPDELFAELDTRGCTFTVAG